jgi:hypothetical protein
LRGDAFGSRAVVRGSDDEPFAVGRLENSSCGIVLVTRDVNHEETRSCDSQRDAAAEV